MSSWSEAYGRNLEASLADGGPHHGLAPQAAPVLQTQHAPAGLIAHRTPGTDRQVPLHPLVGHGDLGHTAHRAIRRREMELHTYCMGCGHLRRSHSNQPGSLIIRADQYCIAEQTVKQTLLNLCERGCCTKLKYLEPFCDMLCIGL